MPNDAVLSRPDGEAASERRGRILDAAERCFVRSGFHRTTIQDVAAEAGMSPGNLYRYFPAKDAIVAGLAERDRGRLAEDFGHLGRGSDVAAAIERLGRKHFIEAPREKAILCLEIWAESTRNPAIAALIHDFDIDIRERLTSLFRQAQESGAIARSVDPSELATLVSSLADGLFVGRAIVPTFDAEQALRHIIAVTEAAAAGRVDLARASRDVSNGRSL